MIVATGQYHPRRTGLAMPDVVRRLVERRAPQLVMAASAADQQMTHALPHIPALSHPPVTTGRRALVHTECT